jgi:hypothetical protein
VNLLRFRYLGLSALAVAAAGAYVIVGGARPAGPALFLVAAAGVVCLVIALLGRSAMSLLRGPQEAEVRVATGRRRKELEREKQGLLKALKELEFDHEMHKISDGDYQDIAALYRARAVRVMRQLDEAQLDLRALVERDAALRRGQRAGKQAAHVSNGSAAVKEPTPTPPAPSVTGLLCGTCETRNDADAMFCKRCGARLGEEVAS